MEAKRESAFTLIELLVVLAILAVLAGIVLLTVSQYLSRARQLSDEANVRTLNTSTLAAAMAADASRADLFEPDSSDNEKMLWLVQEGHLSMLPVARQDGVAFRWDDNSLTWTLGAQGASSPLGSGFAEISQGMILLMEQYYEENGHYARSWKPFSYTDLGLDSSDWGDPVAHAYYSPGGNWLGIRPEDGYVFWVESTDGTMWLLTYDLHWNLWYDCYTEAWYYHHIDPAQEIDIATLEIESES